MKSLFTEITFLLKHIKNQLVIFVKNLSSVKSDTQKKQKIKTERTETGMKSELTELQE